MTDTPALQQKLADKLWHTVFGSADSALLSPWRLRLAGKDHATVRMAELEVIQNMLDDLDDLQAGRKIFNARDELVDAPVDELAPSVRLNPLIEQAGEDPLNALRVPGLAHALEKVRLEADILALRHSLNVRRIGLRADMLAESLLVESLSERPVDADWLLRWQECAARAVATDFQEMWARVLVDEVRQPGTHSLRTLAFLASISRADMATISFMARLDLNGFVCKEASSYFQADIHGPMLAQMEDMGLLQSGPDMVRLKSVSKTGFRAVLRCHDKALYIEGEGRELAVTAHRFTPLGRQVMALFPGRPDTGYLFSLGNALKKRGYHVDIGDWLGQSDGGGLFSEKLSL